MCDDISGEAVWDALISDPDFLEDTTPQMREILESFVAMLPDLLGNLLDEPVAIATLFRAKATFLDSAVGGGMISKMIATVSSRPNPEGAIAEVEESWERASLQLQAIARDVARFLEYNEVETEEEVILGLVPPLSAENLRRYRAGELTIGDLLLSQPRLFIKNS